MKQQISSIFKNQELKDIYLKPKKHYEQLIDSYPDDEHIRIYNQFSTYFTDFFDIRKHIFLGIDAGTVAYRLIDENLLFYLTNMEKIKKLPQELIAEIPELSEINSIMAYNNCLSQVGISKYNQLLGGYSLENGQKIQGVNEKINQYAQKHKIKLPKLNFLYKMILSDQISASFMLDVIDTDQDLIQILKGFLAHCHLSPVMNLSE